MFLSLLMWLRKVSICSESRTSSTSTCRLISSSTCIASAVPVVTQRVDSQLPLLIGRRLLIVRVHVFKTFLEIQYILKISNCSYDRQSQSLRPARAARLETPATGGTPEAACVHDSTRRRGDRPLDGLAGRTGGCRRRGGLRLLRWTRTPHRQLPEARGPAAQTGVRTRAPRLHRCRRFRLLNLLYFSLKLILSISIILFHFIFGFPFHPTHSKPPSNSKQVQLTRK